MEPGCPVELEGPETLEFPELRRIILADGQRVVMQPTLEDAVRKMTSAVADRLGLRRRGLLREGMFADVVVFDPETIMDHATFEDPHLLSQGVRHVWVNGRQVVCDGVHTGTTPGRFVRPWE